jgi:hypothetical protein
VLDQLCGSTTTLASTVPAVPTSVILTTLESYGANLDCAMTLTAPTPLSVSVVVLRTELSVDQLSIFSGSDPNAAPLGTLSGYAESTRCVCACCWSNSHLAPEARAAP